MPLLDRVVQGAGAMTTAYCGYRLFELYYDFPEPCRLMLAEARAHEKVREHVGESITRSMFWSGTVTDRRASVQIPVTGEHGSGVIVGKALRTNTPDNAQDLWRVLMLELDGVPGQPSADLLPPPVITASPEALAAAAAAHGSLGRRT